MRIKQVSLLVSGYLWSIALSTIGLYIFEITLESSMKNRVFLSYSSTQLALLIFLLISSMILIRIAWKMSEWSDLSNKIVIFFQGNHLIAMTIIYILISGLIGCLALVFVDSSSVLMLKLLPIIVWIFFILFMTLILISIISNFLINLNSYLRALFSKVSFRQFLIIIFLVVVFCIFFFNSSSFLATNSVNLPTVVVSFSQGLSVLWVILTIEFLCKVGIFGKQNSPWVTLAIFFGLFITAGIIWNNIPFMGHFFAIGPFRPDEAWFPHSDSVRFDLAAQSVLIGEGLNFKQYSDNPLMVGFVTFLHFIKGGNYLAIVALQTWIFSVIPGVIFLIGKKYFSYSAGIGGGMFYILRVSNLLMTSKDNGTANPKILLSDGLVELFIILIVLVFLYWWKLKSKKPQYLILLGGLFGLSTLVRANVWLILLALLITIFFLSLPKFRTGLFWCFLVLSATIISILPWMWRSYNTIGTPFYMLYKFQHSIYEERYQLTDVENPNINQNPNSNLQQDNLNSKPADGNVENETNISDQRNTTFLSGIGKYYDVLKFTLANITYSLGNSILILPQNPESIDLHNNVLFPELFLTDFNDIENSQKNIEYLSLLIVLIPLTIGTVIVIKKNNGFAILLSVYFAYIIASALALTRGSRYSQPVEWVFLLLLAMGMAFIIKTIVFLVDPNEAKHINLETSSHENRNEYIFDKLQSLIINSSIIFTYSISVCLILPDYLGIPVFPLQERTGLVQELLENIQKSPKIKGNLSEINEFLADNEAEIQKGRVIYSLPLVGTKNYEHSFFRENSFLKPKNQDYLALFIISPAGGRWVKINIQQPDWPKQSLVWKDVLFLGCKYDKYSQLSTLIVSNEDRDKQVFQSNPKISCGQNKQ